MPLTSLCSPFHCVEVWHKALFQDLGFGMGIIVTITKLCIHLPTSQLLHTKSRTKVRPLLWTSNTGHHIRAFYTFSTSSIVLGFLVLVPSYATGLDVILRAFFKSTRETNPIVFFVGSLHVGTPIEYHTGNLTILMSLHFTSSINLRSLSPTSQQNNIVKKNKKYFLNSL